MNKLFIDIGNSRLKWLCEVEGVDVASGNIAADSAGLQTLFTQMGSHLAKVQKVWVASVASAPIERELERAFNARAIAVEFVQSAQWQCGVLSHYETQSQLGVDRWLALLAARECAQKGHIIVVDVGTAVTIDWLSDNDVFKGGVIFPGHNLMRNALNQQTSAIEVQNYGEVGSIFGLSTQQCVDAGVHFASLGAVAYTVQAMREAIASTKDGGCDVSILVTGGGADAKLYQKAFEYLYEPNLVLLGMKRLIRESER